jgi:hypothetical protein
MHRASRRSGASDERRRWRAAVDFDLMLVAERLGVSIGRRDSTVSMVQSAPRSPHHPAKPWPSSVSLCRPT